MEFIGGIDSWPFDGKPLLDILPMHQSVSPSVNPMSQSQPVRKAIIPAAGYGTRMMPASRVVRKELFPIVDRDGFVKPVIQLIVEEAVDSGIEEVCIVVPPGGDTVFRSYFSEPESWLHGIAEGNPDMQAAIGRLSELGSRITYVVQDKQDGYGDAVLRARSWTGEEPVLVMLGDHVYISGATSRCARQLIDVFETHHAPVSGVIRKHENDLKLFGTVYGSLKSNRPPVYELTRMVEKPAITYARKHLHIEAMPASAYLCFFGLHVLTSDIFDCLEKIKADNLRESREIQFTAAQAMLVAKETYYACEIDGTPYDIGVPEGYVRTVAAFGV